jgi:hypothetical protein
MGEPEPRIRTSWFRLVECQRDLVGPDARWAEPHTLRSRLRRKLPTPKGSRLGKALHDLSQLGTSPRVGGESTLCDV